VTEPEPLPTNGYTICVDPGHGFDDPGAFSDLIGDTYEKDITLATAKLLKIHLEQLGFKVIMTHDGTSFPKTSIDDGNNKYRPEERASYANSIANTIDYYIALHCDLFPESSEVKGTRIFYGDNVDPNTQPHVEIAEAIANKIAGAFPDAKEPTVAAEYFYVVKYIKVPSTLVEMGFISNPDDAANLIDPEWQDKFAKSVADGLYDYFVEKSN